MPKSRFDSELTGMGKSIHQGSLNVEVHSSSAVVSDIERGQREIDRAIETLKAGAPREAMEILDRVGTGLPIQNYFFIRATVRLALGEYEVAEREITKELLRFPSNTGAKNLLGQIGIILRDAKPKTVETSGANPRELLTSAELSLNDGDARTALAIVDALKNSGSIPSGLHMLRARILLAQNKLLESRLAVRSELLKSPDSSAALLFMDQICELELEAVKETGLRLDTKFLVVLGQLKGNFTCTIESLWSIYALAKDVCMRRIPGDFVRIGPAADGCAVMLAWIATHFSALPRKVRVLDSSGEFAADGHPMKSLAHRLGVEALLSSSIGEFSLRNTEETCGNGGLAFIHVDSANSEELRVALEKGFFNLAPGGSMVIRKGASGGPSEALGRFRTRLSRPIQMEDIGDSIFFQRP